MKKRELERIGDRILLPLRDESYAELRRRAQESRVDVHELKEADALLSVEVQYMFDAKDRFDRPSAVRVMAE